MLGSYSVGMRSIITVRDLKLTIREGTLPWDESARYNTVDVVLDGKNLVEWLRPYTPAGTDPPEYLGHPIGTDMTALLLGLRPEDDFDARTALLGCTCTDIGCGALLTRIDIDPDTVTWSDFTRARGPQLDYDGLGLRFDRSTYMKALTEFEQGT